jgi:hypothetical protein
MMDFGTFVHKSPGFYCFHVSCLLTTLMPFVCLPSFVALFILFGSGQTVYYASLSALYC